MRKLLLLVPTMMVAPGCVLSLSPLPSSYGPPTWQTQSPIYAGPGTPSYSSGTPAPTPAAGPLLENNAPAEAVVPDLRGPTTVRPSRNPRRVCYLPE